MKASPPPHLLPSQKISLLDKMDGNGLYVQCVIPCSVEKEKKANAAQQTLDAKKKRKREKKKWRMGCSVDVCRCGR